MIGDCERNLAGPEEDVGLRVAYTPCGRTGTHVVELRIGDCYMCPEHADEAAAAGAKVRALVLIEVAS